MNRIMTALALASMFAAAPAFAKHQARKPAVSSVARADKAPEGGEAKAPEGEKATPKKKPSKKPAKKADETKTETKTEAAPAK
jgi:hypothetical protein